MYESSGEKSLDVVAEFAGVMLLLSVLHVLRLKCRLVGFVLTWPWAA